MKQLIFVSIVDGQMFDTNIFFTPHYVDLLSLQQLEDNCDVLMVISSYLNILKLNRDAIADYIIKIAFMLLDKRLYFILA